MNAFSGGAPGPAQAAPRERSFLFLQGPISPYFAEVAAGLQALGHRVHRVNLCLGDRLFWPAGQPLPRAEDYTGTAGGWPGWIDAFMERHAVTDVLLLGEQRGMHQAAIRAAKARGAQVVVTDFGYFRPDWITLERDAMGGGSRFPRNPAEILALAEGLPPAELHQDFRDDFRRQAAWDVLYHVANLVPGPFRHYRSHQLHHPLATYAGIGRRLLARRAERAEGARALAEVQAAAGYWLFAMQMETDFSLRAYSRYADLDQPIREVLESFALHAEPRTRLLFKIHPLDPCLKSWPARVRRMAAELGVEDRIAVVRHGPLDDMIAAARGTVTVNSTVGLRALTMGCPVIALGDAVYRVPGLTWDGGLDRFWAEATPPDPALRDAFLAALQACTQLRGVFYAPEGRAEAVRGTVLRLHAGRVGAPLTPAPRETASA
jgi:capsular polysaccharide export protein